MIGLKGRLPWNLDEDMKRFKYLTMGRNVLMGRETFDSIIPKLEGRRVYVLSETKKTEEAEHPYPVYVNSIDEVLDELGEGAALMIAGGESVYKATLHLVDEIFLTLVDCDFEGDARYYPMEELMEEFEIDYERKMGGDIPYAFLRLVRKNKN